jgi:hypothetical protein
MENQDPMITSLILAVKYSKKKWWNQWKREINIFSYNPITLVGFEIDIIKNLIPQSWLWWIESKKANDPISDTCWIN